MILVTFMTAVGSVGVASSVLNLLEVWLALIPAPFIITKRSPLVVVTRRAAREHQPVDSGGAAECLSIESSSLAPRPLLVGLRPECLDLRTLAVARSPNYRNTVKPIVLYLAFANDEDAGAWVFAQSGGEGACCCTACVMSTWGKLASSSTTTPTAYDNIVKGFPVDVNRFALRIRTRK